MDEVPRVFRSRLTRGLLIGGWGLFIVLGVAMAFVDEGEDGTRVFGLILAAGFTVLVARAVRVGIRVDEREIVLRTSFRTRRIPRAVVSGAHAEDGAMLLPWKVLVLETTAGDEIRVPEVAQLGERGAVAAAVAYLGRPGKV
jgi:hypothetical protein